MSVKTKTQLQADIDADIVTNGAGAITAAILNPILNNIKDSYQDYIVSMDTATRDALTPSSLLIIFNSDLSRYQYYYSGSWWTLDADTDGIKYSTEYVVKASGNTDFNNPEDDDWRVIVDGENLNFERMESSTWNEKNSITP